MSIKVVWPEGTLALLTQTEADLISRASQQSEIYSLYRDCSLAVLNTGSKTDNACALLKEFDDFEIDVVRNERGIKIELINPPGECIIDGEIITSVRKHLLSVLRDIVQIKIHADDLKYLPNYNSLPHEQYVTNQIFSILRNAGVLSARETPNLAICWGGHSISRSEYDYAYDVGYQLGLRGIDVGTGCGGGIMEAPMRGVIMGQSVQDTPRKSRRIGLTEPSIIAAEPPNSYVSELVILPDIEKRLEAFVRLGHSIIAFPGGPGTVEELLFILALRLERSNRHEQLPLILTCGREHEDYFRAIDNFFRLCFGDTISRYYTIIVDNPSEVAELVRANMQTVLEHRTINHDSYCFNWTLTIPKALTEPFDVNHENMAALNLRHSAEKSALAADLRRAFSGIVAGNIKDFAIQRVNEHGPFHLHGDPDIIKAIEDLMDEFVREGRLTLNMKDYKPCYVLDAD